MAAGYVRLKKGRGRISTENSVSDDQLNDSTGKSIAPMPNTDVDSELCIITNCA